MGEVKRLKKWAKPITSREDAKKRAVEEKDKADDSSKKHK